MITLAIDTSANLCAAALHDGSADAVLAEVSIDIGRGHAERLMDVIAETLEQAGKTYADLGRVAACAGPGSFTGVRVGLATARGIALGLGIPAIGISALEALKVETEAEPVNGGDAGLLVLFDARRGEAYAQFFGADDGRFPDGPFAASYAAIAQMIGSGAPPRLCGSGAPVLVSDAGIIAPVLNEHSTVPASRYARLGARAPAGARPEPLYLRPPDAKPQTGFAVRRA